MGFEYYCIFVGIINIVFRKQLAETTARRNGDYRDIMSIVFLVGGIILVIFGVLQILNIIQVNA